MAKYLCQAQVMIEKEIEAEDEDTAEMMMFDYMYEEYEDMDWVISAHKIQST